MNIIRVTGLRHWLNFYKLYKNAFPKAERKPLWLIRKLQKAGKSDVWRFEENGTYCGLAATINGDGRVLLDYLAVVPGGRGQGHGTKMLRLLEETYEETGFFGEIEVVRPGVEDYELKRRRKQFYLDNGLTALGTRVMLFGVEMELMSYHCTITYPEYAEFYRKNLGEFATKHISLVE